MKYEYLAEEILSRLSDRAGFDGWWGGIDEEIQKEITEEIASVIEQDLRA